MKAFLLTVGLMCVAGPGSAAEPLPRYDMDTHCRKFMDPPAGKSSTPTYAAERYTACFVRNQEAYDELKPLWQRLVAEDQTACVEEEARRTNYGSLRDCALSKIWHREKAERYRKIPKQEFRY